MILTKQIFEKGKSVRGGYSTEQTKLFTEPYGIDAKKKGWVSLIIGKDYPKETIQKFLGLKDSHLSEQRRQGKVNKERGILSFEPVVKHIEWADQYLHPNWQKMRLWVLNRDKFTCIDCKTKDKTLHVHHLKYLRGKFIWEVPHFYLVTLCEDCHSNEHGRDLKAKL